MLLHTDPAARTPLNLRTCPGGRWNARVGCLIEAVEDRTARVAANSTCISD